MAHIIKYKCESCGYEADVYEGRGFMGQHIEMITCPDCKTIQPLVVGGVIADSAPPSRPWRAGSVSIAEAVISSLGTSKHAPNVEKQCIRQITLSFGHKLFIDFVCLLGI